LLVSEDLDELFDLADRIVVMYQGRLSAPLATQGLDIRDVGLMMAGDLNHGLSLQAGAST